MHMYIFYPFVLRLQAHKSRSDAINSFTGITAKVLHVLDKWLWYTNLIQAMKTAPQFPVPHIGRVTSLVLFSFLPMRSNAAQEED